MAEETAATKKIVHVGDEKRVKDRCWQFDVAKVARALKGVEVTCLTAA